MSLRAQDANEIYDRIFRPDTLLSAAETNLKNRIGDLIADDLKVRGRTVNITLTKDDFTRHAIPHYYFEMLQRNVDELNLWISEEQLSRKEIKELITRSVQKYKISGEAKK